MHAQIADKSPRNHIYVNEDMNNHITVCSVLTSYPKFDQKDA